MHFPCGSFLPPECVDALPVEEIPTHERRAESKFLKHRLADALNNCSILIFPLFFPNHKFHPPFTTARSGGGDFWMEVLDEMDVKGLERLYESVWREDGAKERAGERNGSGIGVRGNGARKRKRALWRQIKEPVSPKGLIRFENGVFRVVQRFGQLYVVPKWRYVRITGKGRKTVQEAQEIPVMTYEQFFDKYLSHMQRWNTPDINGIRISGVQQKFLKSIAEEGVLPMTGDIVRGC